MAEQQPTPRNSSIRCQMKRHEQQRDQTRESESLQMTEPGSAASAAGGRGVFRAIRLGASL